jgi:hypothetical protein
LLPQACSEALLLLVKPLVRSLVKSFLTAGLLTGHLLSETKKNCLEEDFFVACRVFSE